MGYFVSLGNDGDNAIHGAWDITWSRSSGTDNTLDAFSTRYAWKQKIGTWALASGIRASYINYTMLYATPDNYIAKSVRTSFNFDAGLMITNQEGFYAGISALNLTEPVFEMKFEWPGQTTIYSVQTKRTYVAAAGGLVNLNRHFDIMLDASASFSSEGKCVRPSAMIRYHHHLALGAALTTDSRSQPIFELQGGYTSTSFKWLNGIAFTAQGPVVETGIVLRFGVERWRVTKIQGDCVSLPVPEPKKSEFSPED